MDTLLVSPCFSMSLEFLLRKQGDFGLSYLTYLSQRTLADVIRVEAWNMLAWMTVSFCVFLFVGKNRYWPVHWLREDGRNVEPTWTLQCEAKTGWTHLSLVPKSPQIQDEDKQWVFHVMEFCYIVLLWQ